MADVLTRPAATRGLALINKSAREVLADSVEVVDLVEPLNNLAFVLSSSKDLFSVSLAFKSNGGA
ncbi:MAG: hypothetical protein FJY56_19080 [Betaproteobacteria bacterium]|nr:hypothetical protein [Betaproteobacteria bacterium]